MTSLKIHVHTIGCQMNVYDSDQFVRIMQGHGYEVTPQIEAADLIILNTCAVRDKAEQKAFSFLGRLADFKSQRPDLIIAVAGCVAQQEGRRILKRMSYIDLVFGPDAVIRLPQLVETIRQRRCRLVDVEMESGPKTLYTETRLGRSAATSEFVTIMRGCDNFCAYCVVPHVRGRESSRRPEEIGAEIKMLVQNGTREVTLLGQNVNSYGQKEGNISFPHLLRQVNAIQGLERIRFTTSHPKDLSDELIDMFAELDKLCHHIHLPVQAGSDTILKRMNRKYTRQRYLERIERLRAVCPQIAISSDFIVGFPGETDADFDQTLSLMEQVRFDSAFAFIYSDRPLAPATRFTDKISQKVKKDRLGKLLDTQKEHTTQRHQSLVGSVQQVLVEGTGKQADGRQWSGRTPTNKIVNFEAPQTATGQAPITIGQTISVRIERALAHSLLGRLPDSPQKGAQSHAA